MRAALLGLPAIGRHRRLLGAFAVDALGSGLFLPFSILFFTATTSLSLPQVGLALSIAALARLPATAGAGSLTDRIGAKHAVVTSNLIQAIGFAAYLLADSLLQVLLAAVVVQVGNSLFWVAYPALVNDLADQAVQERWFALINALRSAGTAIGALGASLAVAIGGTAGYQLIVSVNVASFALAAILTGVDRVPGGRQDPEHQRLERGSANWSVVLHDRPFLAFVGVNIGFGLLSLSFVLAVPVYLVSSGDFPEWTPGVLLGLNAVLGALGATPVVAAVTGRRRDHVLISSQVIIGFGYACVLLAGVVRPGLNLAFAVTAAILVTSTELIQGPVVNAIINECAPDRERGRYLAIFQLTFSIVDVIAPVALTAALARGPFATWVPLIVVAGLDALLLVLVGRRLRVLPLRIGRTPVRKAARRIEADGL